MKMKKLMALVLALTLVLALAACGQTSTPAEGGDTRGHQVPPHDRVLGHCAGDSLSMLSCGSAEGW